MYGCVIVFVCVGLMFVNKFPPQIYLTNHSEFEFIVSERLPTTLTTKSVTVDGDKTLLLKPFRSCYFDPFSTTDKLFIQVTLLYDQISKRCPLVAAKLDFSWKILYSLSKITKCLQYRAPISSMTISIILFAFSGHKRKRLHPSTLLRILQTFPRDSGQSN